MPEAPEDRSLLLAGALALVYTGTAWYAARSGDLSVAILLASVLLGAVLVTLSIIDWRTYRLPDVLTLPLALAGLGFTALTDSTELGWHALAAIFGYVVLFAMAWGYRRLRGIDGIGLGDAKLLAAAGAWLGLLALPMVLLWGCLLALVQALVLMLLGGAIRATTRLAFGPALALSFWLVWLFGTGGA